MLLAKLHLAFSLRDLLLLNLELRSVCGIRAGETLFPLPQVFAERAKLRVQRSHFIRAQLEQLRAGFHGVAFVD